jgi:hypothetical protein
MRKTLLLDHAPIGTYFGISKKGTRYVAHASHNGEDLAHLIPSYALRNAFTNDMALAIVKSKSGYQLRQKPIAEYEAARKTAFPLSPTIQRSAAQLPVVESDHDDMVRFIQNSVSLRPRHYKMPDLIWKSLIRSVVRGKNVMFIGPQGTGKTMAAYAVNDAFERPFFNIPLGATQDPRSTLIGNTHFKHGEGTFVVNSVFVQAIQTPNAIILLDEITRANPEAWNILMSVLDYKQRFLRIDERPDTPTIPVASGVTFLATANIGHQFTSTRTIDRALFDRFSVFEVMPLGADDEFDLLTQLFPDVDSGTITTIAAIADLTRKEVQSDVPHINDIISTRQTIEMAELVYDGFSLQEACEVCVYPFYSTAGGADSERTYIRQLVQKFLPTDLDNSDMPYEAYDDQNPVAMPANPQP